MEPLKNLFNKVKLVRRPRRSTNERSDIYDQILSRINPGRKQAKYPPMKYGQLARLLTGVPTKDLYALLSKMDDGERRGIPAGAIFWTEIRPSKKKP